MRIFLHSLVLPAFALAGPLFSEPNVRQQQQEPLKAAHEQTSPPFTIREQSDELCDSGARQWTGSINVAEGRSMFFCRTIPVDELSNSNGLLTRSRVS